MDLKTLELIVALAEEKSVISAAERLNIPIEDVEKFCNDFRWETKTSFLDQALINRFVSSQGMEIYEKAKKVLHDLETCGKWISDLKPEPAGDITIVTMPFLGTEWLTPRLVPFLEEYPKVNIKLILKNPPIQPGEGDVIISFPVIGPNKLFKNMELVSITHGLYASQKYLDKHGIPTSAGDLDNHRLISFKSHMPSYVHYNWGLIIGLKERTFPRKPYFQVDSLTGMTNAAKLGVGIAELPTYCFAKKSVELVRVLPSLKSPSVRICYIHEQQRENSMLISELYRYLREYSTLKQGGDKAR